jgi:heat shock protein HslJ
MTPKKLAVLLTIFAGLMLTGCACTPSNGETNLLSGTGWLLTELNGTPVASSPAMTLMFSEDGNVNGNDGCNLYSSTYTAENGTINISEEMTVTERACSGPIMQQAKTFTTALKQAVTYRTENKQLRLMAADGSTLAVFLQQGKELRGTSWDVSGYDNGQGTIMRINNSGRKLTMKFDLGSTVSGSSGCNSYSADYTYSAVDQTLEPGRLLRTAMACTDGNIMQQEGMFIAALQTVKSYHINGNTLTLKAADGGTAIILVRQ